MKFSCIKIICLFLILSSCSSDDLYQSLILEEVEAVDDVTDVDEETEEDLEEVIDIDSKSTVSYPTDGIKVSTFGFSADDSTEAFLEAVNSDYETLIIDKQDSDWVLQPTTLVDVSNKRIYIEDEVVVKAKENSFTDLSDVLLQLKNCSDITIDGYGATFQMNKDEYDEGEWRHTLSIKGSENITIRGLELNDSGGDGIYIGPGTDTGSYSENILVEDVTCTNHKRQGMSIISAQDVWVKNSVFTETNGILPEAGLDIEPNNSEERLVNINFENCSFTNNNHAGIVLSLGQMTESSLPISINFESCNTSYNASEDNAYVESEIILTASNDSPVGGEVYFKNLTVDGSDWCAVYSRKRADAFYATFEDCTFKNVSQAGTKSPIYLETGSYFDITESLGGFTFENTYIEYDTDLPFMWINGAASLTSVQDITGTFTVDEPNNYPVNYVNYDSLLNINVSIDVDYLD